MKRTIEFPFTLARWQRLDPPSLCIINKSKRELVDAWGKLKKKTRLWEWFSIVGKLRQGMCLKLTTTTNDCLKWTNGKDIWDGCKIKMSTSTLFSTLDSFVCLSVLCLVCLLNFFHCSTPAAAESSLLLFSFRWTISITMFSCLLSTRRYLSVVHDGIAQ